MNMVPSAPADWADVLDTLVHPRRFTLGDQEAMHLYDARTGVLDFESESLSTWHWGVDGPRVLLVHGWESRSTHWHAWIPALLAAGFRISAIDLPAHGHSSRVTTDVVQAGLIVHDPFDQEMPIAESKRLAASWPTAHLLEPAGLGHRRILRDPEVIRQGCRH